MAYLDLDELPGLFDGRLLWSARGPGARPGFAALTTSATRGCRSRTRCARWWPSAPAPRPDGPIRLLTHLRYFGHCFNPVSFYYCYDAAGERVAAVVAEVTNTPWGERHAYVLDAHSAADHGSARCALRASSPKRAARLAR